VRCEVDMYGSVHEFEGRITGFTMGTGQTLAVLPPQNARGNYVKIVQGCRCGSSYRITTPTRCPCSPGCRSSPTFTTRNRPRGRTLGSFCSLCIPFRKGPPCPAAPRRPRKRQPLFPEAPVFREFKPRANAMRLSSWARRRASRIHP
jgi:membrane fusion protein (multidrug efflux system)